MRGKQEGVIIMHYLITGGSGFIGTHLTRRLTEAGHEVTVLDDLSAGYDWEHLSPTGAHLVRGSVLDRFTVERSIDDVDWVIHLAAVVGVQRAMQNRIRTLRVCHQGTQNVLSAATARHRRVFVASSSAIYGKITNTPVAEDNDVLLGSPQKDGWLYSTAKMCQEHLALAYHHERGARVWIGRLFNVIGPLQSGTGGMVVPRLVTQALDDLPLTVYGDGKQTRTFVYIDDALDGIQRVTGRGEQATPYNIGGTCEISILDLARMIRRIAGSSSPIRLIPYREVLGEDFEETQKRRPSIDRLCQLGYAPRYSLEESLRAIIDHHRRDPE